LVIATPVYAATGDWRKTLWMTCASGMTEPLGAILSLTFLRPFLSDWRISVMLVFVGGLMTCVAVMELLPEGYRYRQPKSLLAGFVMGVTVMLMAMLMIE
jgi:ZIP family zinc transporter